MSAQARKARAKTGPLKQSALLFAALGDETRLHLVNRLGAGEPLSIVSLTAGTGVTRQAVTKHLRVLARAGFVRGRRLGRETVWQLQPAQLDAARAALAEISAQWDVGLSRLKEYLERSS